METKWITFTVTPSEPFGEGHTAMLQRLIEQGRLSMVEGEADAALRQSPTLDDSLARAARLIYLLVEGHSNPHGIHQAGFAVAWTVAFIEDVRSEAAALKGRVAELEAALFEYEEGNAILRGVPRQ